MFEYMRVSKAMVDQNNKDGLVPRLQEGDMIWFIKTDNGWIPVIKFVRA
jgi:hypothetical protein